MTRKTYEHSAYWYAYHYGWTYSEAKTYTGKYLDIHSYRPRMREVAEGESYGDAWFERRNASTYLDSTFNPLLLGACIAMDIGVIMRDEVKKLANPKERDRIKRELMRDLRIVRRPFYYAREKARRRELAAARRKLSRRTTTAPMPTPTALLTAWNERKASRESMIRLGGMLHDIEFELWPDRHCLKADELLHELDMDENLIHAVVSHGYGICCDTEPVLYMEKVLFAVDELTGLIGAAARMRPTGLEGMDAKSLNKKFKDKKFAAGCSRDVISRGAEMLGMDLSELFTATIEAMREP